jgi:phosphoglycerate dehydrogenase-like enzyme
MKLSVHLLRQPDPAALAHFRAHLNADVHVTFGPDLSALSVVMSPHLAGVTDGTERLRMTHLAVLFNAAARGNEMPNRVDLRAGY